MGQAPATDRISLRTVPRNFPGRSGTREDKVYLCSPETAAASALTGVITDPRDARTWRTRRSPIPLTPLRQHRRCWSPPLPAGGPRGRARARPEHRAAARARAAAGRASRCPCCSSWATTSRPTRSCRPARGCCRTAATSRRSASSRSSRSTRAIRDRAMAVRDGGGHVVVGGGNYGQGSSREHAALAPRYLGLRVVHRQGVRAHPLAEPRQLRRPAAHVRRPRGLRPDRDGRRC